MDMYECLKLPFDKVVIDSMADKDGSKASYVRLSYNGFFFYFSYHGLRPVTPNFNCIECILREQDIYVIAFKISSNSYRICWLGDCDSIEFRMVDLEGSRGSSGYLTVFLGAVVTAFAFCSYITTNSDNFAVCIIFLIFFAVAFVFSLICFAETFSKNFIEIRSLLRKNLMQEKDLFSPFTKISENHDKRLNRVLPKELSLRNATVEAVHRERRKVSSSFYNASTDTFTDDSYTKCMVNMICDGEKYTFEYKELTFPDGYFDTDIAPFIATGDRLALYWHEPKYKEPLLDQEESPYGIRIICLHNKTTDDVYEGHSNIELVTFSKS